MKVVDPVTLKARQSICRDSCKEHCAAYAAGTLDHADPRAACPRRDWILSWGCYGDCNNPPPAPARPGLGDLVHAVAHPIAKAIDALAGTNLQNCGGCAKRREALNRLAGG